MACLDAGLNALTNLAVEDKLFCFFWRLRLELRNGVDGGRDSDGELGVASIVGGGGQL